MTEGGYAHCVAAGLAFRRLYRDGCFLLGRTLAYPIVRSRLLFGPLALAGEARKPQQNPVQFRVV
jgi:hypothetical protein